MAAPPFNDARDALQRKLTDRLTKVPASRKLHPEELESLGHEAILALFDSEDTRAALVDALTAHGALGKTAAGQWMKTDEIASLLGFSAPYVRALLDNEPFFQGKVARTSGGQRRVLASDLRKWMQLKSVKTPEERMRLPDYERQTPDYFTGERESEPRQDQRTRLASRRHRPGLPKTR